MGNQNESYARLAEKYGVKGSVLFAKILESMITPEEGELVLELWQPMTSGALAKKLNIDENSLHNQLDSLVKKKVINTRQDSYSAATRLIPLCHSTVNLSVESDELWTDFFFKEWRYVLAEERYNRRLTGRPSVHRILPALQALAVSPNIRPEEVFWYENLDALLQRSKDVIFARCVCRAQHHKCDNKVELCMHVSLIDNAAAMSRWANLKHYTYREALDELYAAEDAGMCHLSQNHPYLAETCNCCDSCCRVINPLINAARDYDLNDPSKSRFQASIDQDLCSGCQTCMERCMFNAIEMVKTGGSKKMKARVIEKKCMGCGLCVYKCPSKAIKFNVVRPPSYIPDQTRERAMSWDPVK